MNETKKLFSLLKICGEKNVIFAKRDSVLKKRKIDLLIEKSKKQTNKMRERNEAKKTENENFFFWLNFYIKAVWAFVEQLNSHPLCVCVFSPNYICSPSHNGRIFF